MQLPWIKINTGCFPPSSPTARYAEFCTLWKERQKKLSDGTGYIAVGIGPPPLPIFFAAIDSFFKHWKKTLCQSHSSSYTLKNNSQGYTHFTARSHNRRYCYDMGLRTYRERKQKKIRGVRYCNSAQKYTKWLLIRTSVFLRPLAIDTDLLSSVFLRLFSLKYMYM